MNYADEIIRISIELIFIPWFYLTVYVSVARSSEVLLFLCIIYNTYYMNQSVNI